HGSRAAFFARRQDFDVYPFGGEQLSIPVGGDLTPKLFLRFANDERSLGSVPGNELFSFQEIKGLTHRSARYITFLGKLVHSGNLIAYRPLSGLDTTAKETGELHVTGSRAAAEVDDSVRFALLACHVRSVLSRWA